MKEEDKIQKKIGTENPFRVPEGYFENLTSEAVSYTHLITATDPVTSLFGAFGKYIYDNGIQLADVEQVMLTGVGSPYRGLLTNALPTPVSITCSTAASCIPLS